ncbi:hypothetical protein [Jeotgalibacillus proteolyticus]|uniref:Uncharacterized protein n=1 Tax=Jeotgalibacillus proteolyticus TaxID=2082395 RepID=A0A2S5GB78_9BACL|nr:hypothetical protein [Jeotgalibacillus proteolyticus]PPA70174.1 hypothetical protein C4B60_11345 [Jeotgalibacillus proteolyticus]
MNNRNCGNNMYRDKQTGKFLKGNRFAVGNKGNRKSKWGNSNAVKHGLYENLAVYFLTESGFLQIRSRNGGVFLIPPEAFENHRLGMLIREDIAQILEQNGIRLEVLN